MMKPFCLGVVPKVTFFVSYLSCLKLDVDAIVLFSTIKKGQSLITDYDICAHTCVAECGK